MDRETFIHCIPADQSGTLSSSTIDLWHTMFEYVVRYGQTDCYDHRLCRHIDSALKKWPSGNRIATHLRRIARAGIFDAHKVLAKPDIFYSSLGPSGSILSGGPAPGVFHCYTLAGKEVDLELAGRRNFEPPGK
jgi:hypothetical protein